LRFARRALHRIKTRLGFEATEKLHQPDIEEADLFWREAVANNANGEFKPAREQLEIQGLEADEFFP
jgi:hypothetical protein